MNLNLLTVNFAESINNAPTVTEQQLRKADYVYFDTDNLFPQKLIRLADNCPIHSAAIMKHAFFVAGDGIEFEDASDGEIQTAMDALKELVGDEAQFRQDLATDQSYFNGHSVAFQYSRGRELLKVKHYDLSTLRAGKKLKDGKPTHYWYSSDWKEATNKRVFNGSREIYKPKDYESIDATEKRSGVMFLYSKGYKPGKQYYPEPNYLAAIKYVDTEIRLSQYIDNLTIKGFRAGTHIHLYKEMDEEQAKKAEEKINEKFTDQKAPDIVVTYGGDPSSPPTINQMPVFTNAEIITTVGNELDKKIDTAHAIPSMLYTSWKVNTGIDGMGKAVKETLEYYQNSVVAPQQRQLEKTLKRILSEAGIEIDLRIKPVNPIRQILDKDVMMNVLERNEIRQEMGWPELEGSRGTEIPGTKKSKSTEVIETEKEEQ